MSGEELRKKLEENGISISQIAELLEVKNYQTVQSWFKANDVKSGLLERIATVLGKSVPFFYQSDNNKTLVGDNNNNNQNTGVESTVFTKALDEIAEQRRVTQKAQEHIDSLIGIINELTGKLGKL